MPHRRRTVFSLLATFALIATLFGTAQAVAAQGGDSHDIRISTFNPGDDSPNTDPCYVLVDFSNEGCDRNDDGSVTFQDVPTGTYTVHQTADMGDREVQDFTIEVSADSTEFSAYTDEAAGQPGTADIRIETMYKDGSPIADVCYVLVDYSNEGCDRNDDQIVTFDDVPHGTYTLRQTQTEDGAPLVPDREITVSEDSTSFVVEVDQVPS
jgi:hypothetical protein